MKILHLTYRDSSGVPSRWAAAHRLAGHETRLLVEFPHPYGYTQDEIVSRWTPGTRSPRDRAARIADHLAWADAVMAYDHPYYLDTAIASGKPVLYRALGTSARENAAEIRTLLESSSVVRASTGLAHDALLLDVPLTGAPYPLPDPAMAPVESFACHAPSDREMKKTGLLLEAAAAAGWTVDLVENADNETVLDHKRRCALVLDSGPGALPDGYGVNSVEAMALGLPTISGASARIQAEMRQAGSPVILVDTVSDLIRELDRLRDRERRLELGAAGRAFVDSFHSAALRAAEDTEALTR